jgi:hypothetical protein
VKYLDLDAGQKSRNMLTKTAETEDIEANERVGDSMDAPSRKERRVMHQSRVALIETPRNNQQEYFQQELELPSDPLSRS